MNLSQLETALLARLNMATDDPLAGSVTSLLNEANHLVEVSSPNGWPWLRRTSSFSTVVGQAGYTFAEVDSTTTVAKITDVKVLNDTNYVPLVLVSQREQNRDVVTTTTGFPTIYEVENTTLFLAPSPEGVYTVAVNTVITEPELTQATDTPLIPAQYHSAIIAAALVLYYQTLQDINRAQVAQGMLDGWIKRIHLNAGQNEGGTRVRVRDWLYA